MTPMIETTRRALYQYLANLKAQKKMTGPLKAFESVLEDHLEALRKEHERDVMVSADLMNQRELLHDAYEGQKARTVAALTTSRDQWDEIHKLRDQLKNTHNALDTHSQRAEQATAKLSQQTQTIIALHRVVKDQQSAQASLEALLKSSEVERNRGQAEAHRQIMAAEKVCDERWEMLESRQELIVSQRKAIETLTFELASVRKRNEKRSFWRFFGTKTHESKVLPQK